MTISASIFWSERSTWRRELISFARALSGAFLFGIPLLFTMEMWWIGAFADLWKLLVFLGLAFAATFGLAFFAGFKEEPPSAASVANQAAESMAVAIVGSIMILVALNRIWWGDPLDAVLGKIVVQAVPLSIGAALANAVFGRGESRNEGGEQQTQHGDHRMSKELANDVGATAIGAIFIGFSIAPTAEVTKLAAEMTIYHEIALVALSLLVGYAIVFVSGFDPSSQPQDGIPLFQHPITETTLAYVVALLVALMSLYLFDRIELGDPLSSVLSRTIVLGFPATVGGAAGRLAV